MAPPTESSEGPVPGPEEAGGREPSHETPPRPPGGSLSRGHRLGGYEIVGQIGRGGMGQVYRARDTRLEREVAIKVLSDETARDERRWRRLVGEARAASALNHPNIVTVYEMGDAESGPYIVTELVEGETVRELLARGPLPPTLALDIAIQTLTGLGKAHRNGILHRDLKPENLMVSRDGFVKILDFGLAKLLKGDSDESRTRRPRTLGAPATEQGTILGTAAYMSPEQVRGEPLTPSSDLYSVGVVLYEMVTGRSPFLRPTSIETLTSVLHDRPQPVNELLPAAPADLSVILDKTLSKRPVDRVASAGELESRLRSLRATLDSQAVPAPPGLPTLRMDLRDSDSPAVRVRRAFSKRPGGSRLLAAAVLLALVAGAIFVARLTRRSPESLAVLPFATDDPSGAYLSDGITESLTNSLSQVPGIKVVPRPVAFAYRGREGDFRKVGRELQVKTLLTGRVSRREGALLVQAELIEVGTGSQLWGNQYSRKAESVLDVPEEIASGIAERLRGTRTARGKIRPTRGGTGDGEAYQLYLKGRYAWGKRTEEGILGAIDYFRQAVEHDPKYALAYSGLADSFILLGDYDRILPKDGAAQAAAAATRALSLDPELAQAHTSLAYVRLYNGRDWVEAERGFRRAIALAPNDANAHHGYGVLRLAQGRFEEARSEIRRAQELDPISLIIAADLARTDFYAREYDPAIAKFQKVLQLDPDFVLGHVGLGLVYVRKKEPEKAVSEFDRAHVLSRRPATEELVRAYQAAAAGRREEALRIMDGLRPTPSGYRASPIHVAMVYGFLQELDRAFAWLEKGFEERYPDMIFLKVDPTFDPLHADPRFSDLVRRLGLPEPSPKS